MRRMDVSLETLRYPIGRFVMPDDPLAASDASIDRIETLPGELLAAVGGLSDDQLDTPYRPQGWTARQHGRHHLEHIASLRRRRGWN